MAGGYPNAADMPEMGGVPMGAPAPTAKPAAAPGAAAGAPPAAGGQAQGMQPGQPVMDGLRAIGAWVKSLQEQGNPRAQELVGAFTTFLQTLMGGGAGQAAPEPAPTEEAAPEQEAGAESSMYGMGAISRPGQTGNVTPLV